MLSSSNCRAHETNRTLIKFSRFWNADTGYCYDVLDSPDGSEIFEGDAPMTPRGCIAQAWTVAEVFWAWVATE
jgi:glycogen debranching enzyme